MHRKIIGLLLTSSIAISSFPGFALTARAEGGILDGLELPYDDPGYLIAGNITLPEKINGQDIEWSSSSDMISTEARNISSEGYGKNYTKVPAGEVTRPAYGQPNAEVTLTAKVGSETKDFKVTVKSSPQYNYDRLQELDPDKGGFSGYLYASFIEPPVDQAHQQTFIATSDDGMNWKDLNNNKPILTSTMGTKGLRDHYIIRSPEGDRFYIIATDLDCSAPEGWGAFSTQGSKYIMVWESDDLVNWSDQRMVKIADDTMGCAWAPEAIYDKITGEYLVYFAGKDMDPKSPRYNKDMKVFVAKTRDFYSFYDQQNYVLPASTDKVGQEDTSEGKISGTCTSYIDTTMIKGDDGKYYRVTKYSDPTDGHALWQFLDVADHPMGDFKRVKTNFENRELMGTEGPGWFKLNKDDAEALGSNYCLMLDGYTNPNKGVGFFPNLLDTPNGELRYDGEDTQINFKRVRENFKMRSGAKHGGIVQLTQEEYDRVNEKYATVYPYANQYLTKDFCVSAEGTTDQSNASLDNSPQIKVSANKKAKLVVKTDLINEADGARVSWAQNGGNLSVKLSAADTADGDGKEIAKFDITTYRDYTTRVSDIVKLSKDNIGDSEYLIVEIESTADSWIDYIEFMNGDKPVELAYGFTKCEAVCDGNSIAYSAKYKLPEDAPKNVRVFIGVYDKNGALAAVNADKTSGEFTLPSAAEAYTMKAFIWEDMKPLYPAAEFTIRNKGEEPSEPTDEPKEEYPTTNKDFAYSDKQYLTSAYCTATTGAADQSNASLGGTPQIKVDKSAKLVIKSDMLKYAEGARVSYAQNTGTLSVKLFASDSADGAGEEIAVYDITAASDFNTRNSDTIALDRSVTDGKEYLIVEIECTTTSYIDFVEFMSSIKPFDRLDMSTTFKKNGESVLSAASGDTVTVETTVTNVNFIDRTLEFYIGSEKVGEQTAEANGKVTFSKEITNVTAPVSVAIRDITNNQTFDAGTLPVGDAITNEMIYGTYKTDDGGIFVVSKNDTVAAPSVTIGNKIYTAVRDGNKLVLKDGDTVYAKKDNAAANLGYLEIEDMTLTDTVIPTSSNGNPITGIDKDGNRMYCGDPAAFVDGDTVYLTVGHDVPRGGGYNMPDWQYFTTTDMKNWEHQGLFMSCGDVPWTSNRNAAWASQAIPHIDEDGKKRYYFYHCTQKDGVGVSYTDTIGGEWIHAGRLIDPALTQPSASSWSDIDPTIWVDKAMSSDEDDKVYLMWGNVDCFVCELEPNMIEVKDMNGDGQITMASKFDENGLPTDGDIKYIRFDNLPEDPAAEPKNNGNLVYTEAPWLYRRQAADSTPENLKYEPGYYCFAAFGWPEKLGYAKADSPWGPWTYEETIMEANLTSMTEHPSVFDFEDKTYLISHNGSLPGGNGGGRSITIWEMKFNADGSVNMMEELSTGLWGTSSTITTKDGKYLGHEHLDGQLMPDGTVPRTEGKIVLDIKAYESKIGTDQEWEIVKSFYVPENGKTENYVSIQCLNKPGYYITAEIGGKARLTHDGANNKSKEMTFRTVEAIDGSSGVSFESAAYPGKFLMLHEGILVLSEPWIAEECVFNVSENSN